MKKTIKILLLIGLSIVAIKCVEIARRYFDKDYRNKVRLETWERRVAESQQETSPKEKENKKDTIYQDNEFLFLSKKGEKVDVIRQGESKKIKSKGDTLLSNEYVLFLGDLKNQPEIFIKYNQRYQFEDFPVDVYKGELSPPDFSTYKEAKSFITRIIQGSKRRPNFAGNLNFIDWGCGTNCKSGVILNSKTGEIYEGINTAWGFLSKPSSRLLIAEYGLFENQEKEWLPFCSFCIPKYYVWDSAQKKLVKLK